MTILELENLLEEKRQEEKNNANSLITEQKILYLKENDIPLGVKVVGICEEFIFEGVISLINEKDNNPNYECIHVEGMFARFIKNWDYRGSIWKGDLNLLYSNVKIVKNSFKEAVMNYIEVIVSSELKKLKNL